MIEYCISSYIMSIGPIVSVLSIYCLRKMVAIHCLFNAMQNHDFLKTFLTLKNVYRNTFPYYFADINAPPQILAD